tara:strand:+ start:304 stop:528 length:225 start_codon:yes stop_codon:yes gene_type:complete
MNKQNNVDTFNEKAYVRSGRVAMMRGGPKQRYSGGHNGTKAKAASLAQDSGSDASSDSESDNEEEVNARKHQAL